MPRSYESIRAELDDIVERYRAYIGRDVGKGGLTREEAAKRIRQLGFIEGDAERWLGSKPSSKSPKMAAGQQTDLIVVAAGRSRFLAPLFDLARFSR